MKIRFAGRPGGGSARPGLQPVPRDGAAPGGTGVEREVNFGLRLLAAVRLDLEDVAAIIKTGKKQTNHHQALIQMLNKVIILVIRAGLCCMGAALALEEVGGAQIRFVPIAKSDLQTVWRSGMPWPRRRRGGGGRGLESSSAKPIWCNSSSIVILNLLHILLSPTEPPQTRS
jgi:hypothetical protein